MSERRLVVVAPPDPEADRAEKRATLAANAATDIEQAGRGLSVVMRQVLSNTVDMTTARTLAVIQAYLASAMGAILESVAGTDVIETTQAPGSGIIVPEVKGK